jgi:hypothetical protein
MVISCDLLMSSITADTPGLKQPDFLRPIFTEMLIIESFKSKRSKISGLLYIWPSIPLPSATFPGL